MGGQLLTAPTKHGTLMLQAVLRLCCAVCAVLCQTNCRVLCCPALCCAVLCVEGFYGASDPDHFPTYQGLAVGKHPTDPGEHPSPET
jgi:hypothetical protein